MSFEDIYSCEDCDFKISQETELFFYNSDLKQTIDYVLIMSTAGMSEGFKTKGFVNRSYCKCCDRFVKVYVIQDFDGENMVQKVYQGIKNNLEAYADKIKELKDIKNREKFSIEKSDEIFFINFYELDSCGHMELMDSSKTEEEIIENALKMFHKTIDSQINLLEGEYQKESQIIKVVVDSGELTGEFVRCPECGNEIYKCVSDETPCPNCGGKLICIDTIIWD